MNEKGPHIFGTTGRSLEEGGLLQRRLGEGAESRQEVEDLY